MAKGYWISRYTHPGGDAQASYQQIAQTVVPAFGGRPVIRNGRHETPEGDETGATVVIEFESYEKAVECYRSEEYQKAVPFMDGAGRNLIIIEGIDE